MTDDVVERVAQAIRKIYREADPPYLGIPEEAAQAALAALRAGDRVTETLTLFDQEWIDGYKAEAARQAREEMRERAAKLCEENTLQTGSIGPLMDAGWAACQEACANAIRALSVEGE